MSLDALFRPRSIAVVGASDDPVKIGGRPLAFLLRHGYPGRVFPVNPSRASVQGLPAFPTVAAIPEPVDLAIVVVPAERVLESLEAAAAKGIRAAIVFTADSPRWTTRDGWPRRSCASWPSGPGCASSARTARASPTCPRA